MTKYEPFDIQFYRIFDRIQSQLHIQFELLFERVADHLERSVKFGSPITGAPGQPVRTGNLLRSWTSVKDYGGRVFSLSSDAPYARRIENRVGDIQLRSAVGGFHSVKITTLNSGRVVDFEFDKIWAEVPV